ncbi:MAG TPA: molybdopterin-dependent oxidoreductase [Candidatus Limnocylindrales bacterium]|nr:molybdopterin-dependent oxidoreductase [Candidatus Limnocylindrales bacterium]
MTMSTEPEPTPSRPAAAIAGIASGAAALGAAELLAGLLPGAASPIIAVGDLVIALQPPGAKQLVVDLVGEADKLVLNLVIAAVALVITAGIGVLARTRPGLARIAIALGGILALGAGLRDPLAEPTTTLIVAAAAVAIATWLLGHLMRLAAEHGSPPVAEMPDWGRRRFLGTSVAVVGVAAASGLVGRTLLDRGRLNAVPQGGTVPAPVETAPALPAGVSLDVPELTPLVVPNQEFYRIDTALLVPRPDLPTWRLRVSGMVERPFELTYDELVAMPLHEQYVTIACVSNEVGGDLVGNALWSGVRLKELLDRAGVSPEATQIVGRSVDGFTAGFPTSWAVADDREPLVAVTMNGDPLPADHGYPARLIVPGLYGYVSATKWLTEIELTTLDAFDAYWVPLGWAKEAPILTQSRIDVPRDGASVEAGTVAIAGVAWAPDRGIGGVEVQVDEEGWEPAELSVPISDATWVQFVRRWEATGGEHVIRVRAIDGMAEIQTDQTTRPAPDGARGHHTIRVTVA